MDSECGEAYRQSVSKLLMAMAFAISDVYTFDNFASVIKCGKDAYFTCSPSEGCK
jgi:hypothetical protein